MPAVLEKSPQQVLKIDHQGTFLVALQSLSCWPPSIWFSLTGWGALLMASSKGKGHFSPDTENKWKRENLDTQNQVTSPTPVAVTGKCRFRLIQVQERFTWFPSHTAQGLSGESALSFILMTSYCLCLELLTKNPSHKPYSSPLTPMAPLKYPPLACLLTNRTRKGEGLSLYAVPGFLQYLPSLFSPFLCFWDSIHKGSPIRSASVLHSNLSKPRPEFAMPGEIFSRSPCFCNAAFATLLEPLS